MNEIGPASIGRWGLYLFSFGLWLHPAIAKAGIALMLAGLFSQPPAWRRAFTTPIVKAVLLWLLYLFARLLVSLIQDPAHADIHLEASIRLFWLTGFLLVAAHAKGEDGTIRKCLGLACAGFFAGVLMHWHDLVGHGLEFWRFRYQLGFPTAIPFGQYAATVALILAVLGPRFLKRHPSFTGRSLWVLGLVVALECVALSKSRSVWGTFVLVTLFSLSASVYLRLFDRRRLIVGFSLLAILLLVLTAVQHTAIATRLQEEHEILTLLLQGKLAAIPMQHADGSEYSIGVRIAMWRLGLEHWMERPWIGWGPGATKIWIACCAPQIFANFNDLHSAPVEILLRFGIVGALLIATVVIVTLHTAYRATRADLLAADLFLVVSAALALHLLLACMNFRMLNYDWRFVWYLFGGIAASFIFSGKHHEAEKDRQLG